MKSYLVYLHRRATDGKVFYVGKGANIKRAKNKNARSNWWKRIVEKYGYTVEIYATVLQEWYAFELEKELIAYYGRENLCNMTDGGEGVSGANHSSETKRKISIGNKGKAKSLEHRINLSISHKGKILSKEHIENLKIARIGHRPSKKTMEKSRIASEKKVLCSIGICFFSATNAAKWLSENTSIKAKNSNISKAAKGKQKKAYGLVWKYIDEK